MVAFGLLAGPLVAQEQAGAPVVVTLPSDLSAEERQALVESLAALGRPLAVAETAPDREALPPDYDSI